MSLVKRRRSLYSKEQLMNAVRDEHYKVPSSTIRCHVNEYSSRVGAGPSFHLNVQQEKYLVEAIKSLEGIGVRLIKPVLKKVCSEYIQLVSTNPRYSSKH
jgi:DNA-binding response OmpR family regulator